LYGINRHNNSLILFDRFSLENANTVMFGKSGGGKSYAAKLEILRSLMFGTEVIVIDPENEYEYLAETIGGAFIKISLTSENHLNPFDLPKPQEGENPADVLRSNIINLVGLLRIMFGGLTPEEDALIDTAITQTYASRDTTPTMSDLKTILDSMAGAESLSRRLEKYVSGSYAGFLNNPTNLELKNKLVVFSIRDMEEELRPVAMYIILHFIWNLVRSELKKRILMVDEAWWLMKYDDGASFMFGIAKRARKYFLGVTTITQDVSDFLNSSYGKPILTNSSLQFLFKQSPTNIEAIQKTFNLTDEEKFLLLESEVGEGLFFAGSKHVAIKVIASYTEDQIITSDPAQLLQIEQAKKNLERAEAMVP
ncbi:MAG: ATP-binding protein, partial [Candidatus Azambacteria bacterium]|nr:ATP-binding protein [Candidatus Azambacteria bacterium]